MKHSNSKDENTKQKRKNEIKAVCRNYTNQAETLLKRVIGDIEKKREKGTDINLESALADINKFTDYGVRLVDLIIRRVVSEEKIPHEEKFFSIFEEYTEWISKGKRNPFVEPGHRVMKKTDENSLILDYKVMLGEEDVEQPVELIDRIIKDFENDSI